MHEIIPIQEQSPVNSPIDKLAKLSEAIEDSGFKRKFIAKQFNRTPSWLTRITNGDIPLTEEFEKKFEELLNVDL